MELRKDWVHIAFLTFTPLIGVVGTALYTWRYGFHLWMPLLTLAMYLLVRFSICAGAHEQAEGMSHSWRETRRRAKHHIRQARRNWKDAVRMLQRLPQTA